MKFKQYLSKLFHSEFINNTSWIMAAQIYQIILSLIIGVLSARYLGPNNYGVINYAASYISFFSIASSLGLEGIAINEMVNNRKQEGLILGSGLVMRLIAGFLSMITVCIIVIVVNPNDKILLIVTFLQSLVLLTNSFQIIDLWYQSLLRSKVSAVIKCISYTMMSIYRIWILVTGKNVIWFAFATSLDSLVMAILFLYCYRRDGSHKLKFDKMISSRLIKLSYHLMLSSLMAVIYNQMDRLMIGKIIGQTYVGYYAAASTICHMWLFVPQALANSARPLIIELKKVNHKLYVKRIEQLNGLTLWLGLIISLFLSLLSGPIIKILYGNDYIIASEPLIIMTWSTVFASLSYARSIWLVCENKQKYTKQILIFGVLVNFILNAYSIPRYGINGAALATLVTEFTCCLIAPSFIKETREYVMYVIRSILLFKL